MNPEFWRGRRVLLTGHTGFKGAWLTLWLRRLGAEVTGLSLAPEPGSLADRLGFADPPVDLTDRAATARAVAAADPEIILHLAAQALVRRGYADPVATYAANVMGTVHLLDACRGIAGLRALVMATTDKVYANKEDGRHFREDDPLGGHDPYSASKACTELLVASWRDSFFAARDIRMATARAGNVIGGGDVAADRLVPDFLRAAAGNQPLRLRNPQAVRPWQFVLEPLEGYLRLAQALVQQSDATSRDAPHAINFGPAAGSAQPVAVLVDRLIGLAGKGAWEHDGTPQPAEAGLLMLDSAYAAASLGWQPRLDLETALAWTVTWWRAIDQGTDPARLCLDQIVRFEELAR